jgi:DNA-binding YbaB/EbfC family protein
MTDDNVSDPVELVPDDGGAPSGLGGLDLGSLLGAAQNMQAQMLESQARIAATTVEGAAGGGAVTVTVSGGFEFQRVTISPDALPDGTDPDDHSMLEDLVLAAVRDAVTKVNALQAEANPLSGLGDLGGLGGLFGGA